MRRKRPLPRRGCCAAAIWALTAVAAQAAAPAAFTKAEVLAGHASYHDYCSGCHGDDLGGGGLQGGSDAPPLTGGFFHQDWSKYTIARLYTFVSKTMPEGLEGDLSAKTYADIISFLLAANGAKPGDVALDPNSSTKIGDIADGRTVSAVVDAPIAPN